MGLDYSVTGVFYNKQLATQVGMTQPPATVAEFEDLLAKAKTNGVQPIMQFNKNTAGIDFPIRPCRTSSATRPDRGLDLPEAGRYLRHSGGAKAAQQHPAVGSGRLLPEGRQRPGLHGA